MKSEKRHELQKNELADWLGEQIELAKPHAPMIILGLVLAVALGALAIYYVNVGATAGAGEWSEYFAALSDPAPEVALEKVATGNPRSPVAFWAWQSLGDRHLSRGQTELFKDRPASKISLEKAEAAYKKAEATTDAMLKSRARLSLAKLYESIDKPEEAARYYKLVADAEKDRALGKAAAAGEKRATDPREVALLAWFAQQMSDLPNDLPERPQSQLP